MLPDDPLLLLWAKTGRRPGECHPLLCHMLDVAAVARLLWHAVLPPAATAGLATALGLPSAHAAAWVAFFAALHDLGKASPAFAFSDDIQRARLAAAGFTPPSPLPHAGHGVITAAVLPDVLHEFGLPRPLALRFATAVGGHHGVLPTAATVQATPAEACGGTRWQRVRSDLARRLADLLDVPLADPPRAWG